jgi:geranylgeranyl pyrophosphate synthase
MCEGQILEMRRIGRLLAESDYLTIVQAKTGALFGLAAYAGAVTADGPTELQAALRRYGEAFGLAFQLADDILDLVGTNGRSGKPQGRDLAERKSTLPLILVAQRGRQLRDQLVALLTAPRLTPAALRQAQSLVRDTRALEQAWSRVDDALTEARAALLPVPDGAAKRALLALANDRFPLPVMRV